mgnify:CR=1 FL=1
MSEEELQEFLKMVVPMLKELPEEEIQHQLDQIDMTPEERENFYQMITVLKEQED